MSNTDVLTMNSMCICKRTWGEHKTWGSHPCPLSDCEGFQRARWVCKECGNYTADPNDIDSLGIFHRHDWQEVKAL